MRKLREESKRVISDRLAEGMREAALLWFVFSALDALITGRLTMIWATANTAGALRVWLIAIYIEIGEKEQV